MRSIEAEGDTIDEAIGSALAILQAERDRVEIEILADSTRGLFGFGNRKARVRATLRRPLSADLVHSAVSRETSGPSSHPDHGAGRDAPTSAEAHEMATRAATLLTAILEHLGVPAAVQTHEGNEPGSVRLEVTGEHGGLLIGRRG